MTLKRDIPLTSKRQLGTLRRIPLRHAISGGEDNRILRRVVNAVQKSTKAARADQHQQGVSKRAVPTGAMTVTNIVHNLGYVPKNLNLSQMKGAAVVHRVVSADETTAKVEFSGAATADFWIY